jgi:hypothetical protein
VIVSRTSNEAGDERDAELISEFDHDDGHVRLLLCEHENIILFEVEGEEYSRHRIPSRYSPEVIREVVEFESTFWANQQRPLSEIEYNLEQLHYKLRQWPYIRDQW